MDFLVQIFVSSKTGWNINEAINFLLNNIIQRTETMQIKNDELSNENKNVSLDPDIYKEPGPKKKKKNCV